jgi:hypothetical protein
MNRSCFGIHFKAEGRKLYRCLLDGEITAGINDGEACPHCLRKVDGTDHGEIEVQTRKVIQIIGCGDTLLPDIVYPGDKFQADQAMEAVKPHETQQDTWWCKGLDEEIGLWAYSCKWIRDHRLPK